MNKLTGYCVAVGRMEACSNIQSIPSITEMLKMNSVPSTNELHAGKSY
jgi:hypothetical protein